MFLPCIPAADEAQAAAQPANQQQGQQPLTLQAMTIALDTALAPIEARLSMLQAQLSNEGRRRQNAYALAAPPGQALPLAPLVKELPPPPPLPAGAANAAAVGALPPAGAFPANWAAVNRVGARRGVVCARRPTATCSCCFLPLTDPALPFIVCSSPPRS